MDTRKLTFQFSVDRGGTFTDIYAKCSNGCVYTLKLLSVNPSKYPDAPTEGIRRILSQVISKDLCYINGKINGEFIEWIRMGTTVATNALLERKGERFALIVNSGFKDILQIGNQARPDIFNLNINIPTNLYSDVIEIPCRVIPEESERSTIKTFEDSKKLIGTNSKKYIVLKDLDENEIRQELLKLKNEKKINSLAIVLAHSYACPDHELKIGSIAKELNFENISLSHQVMPMIKLVPRGFTTCLESYVTPKIRKYVQNFLNGFLINVDKIMFMQSDGGLTSVQTFNGSKAIISGPAGGLVGYAKSLYGKETNLPIIGFDMGGTSTDVSRYDNKMEHVYETLTAGVIIQSPQLDINTVAAGGGSILKFQSGIFQVGPESASAYPGPACYRNGGPLTITDANLILGRLRPEYFPKIFGPNEDQELDLSVVVEKFQLLTQEINAFLKSQNLVEKTIEQVAYGFIQVANETMCRPIRNLTEAKGYEIKNHCLTSFGGAGGQHACSIARVLGITEVLIHKYASILSAYGIGLADYVYELQEPCSLIYQGDNIQVIDSKLKKLINEGMNYILNKGFDQSFIKLELYLNIRYEGTDFALMCMPISESSLEECSVFGDFVTQFYNMYKQQFGFNLASDRKLIVDDIRVRTLGKTVLDSLIEEEHVQDLIEFTDFENKVPVYFENESVYTPIYDLTKLKPGVKICGPAILIDATNTILLDPYCTAIITNLGNIKINLLPIVIISHNVDNSSIILDSIKLSVYSHRFMSIAEQMGRILQKTAISTNIKERLDFSCALFGPDGGLVSNAPHIPVHLGSMQEAVRYQINKLKFQPGDVILSNHPKSGGTHLPDLTVITPVFHCTSSHENPLFFVASRGHHSDIGGLTPGSMPPNSTSLKQEGVIFETFYLVKNMEFNEFELIEKFMESGNYPGCSATRNLSENISDLKAQIAANQKGINLINELINNEGLLMVQAYMMYIQDAAETSIRKMLLEKVEMVTDKIDLGNHCIELQSKDYMDDGSEIRLSIIINTINGDTIFNFNGTSQQVFNNWNAPKSITISAIMYCLRCMLGYDIPLNQGCLKPIQIQIPEGSLLNPDSKAAVVGGNVLTSQRVVDVIFKAFEVCAASQGCMNNITFGCDQWGYYETIAGGSGAGPTWHGASGVHTHMTNTRITDIEILENRYPIIMEQFSLRPNSGGDGLFNGGNGVIRVMLFREPVTLSVLTERRSIAPYGLKGGKCGERGINLLIRKDGRVINIGGKNLIEINSGDKICISTPGGGGYGIKN